MNLKDPTIMRQFSITQPVFMANLEDGSVDAVSDVSWFGRAGASERFFSERWKLIALIS